MTFSLRRAARISRWGTTPREMKVTPYHHPCPQDKSNYYCHPAYGLHDRPSVVARSAPRALAQRSRRRCTPCRRGSGAVDQIGPGSARRRHGRFRWRSRRAANIHDSLASKVDEPDIAGGGRGDDRQAVEVCGLGRLQLRYQRRRGSQASRVIVLRVWFDTLGRHLHHVQLEDRFRSVRAVAPCPGCGGMSDRPDSTLTVMTYNVYVGSSTDALLGTTNQAV